MADFVIELPNELIKEFETLSSNSEKMIENMTQAGARVVYDHVIKNMRKSFKTTKSLEEHLKITNPYKTPSDDGTNTKVAIYGYIDGDKKRPAPLIALAREYGTSRGEAKVPFFKKSFVKSDIEKAMLEEQNKYLPKG